MYACMLILINRYRERLCVFVRARAGMWKYKVCLCACVSLQYVYSMCVCVCDCVNVGACTLRIPQSSFTIRGSLKLHRKA